MPLPGVPGFVYHPDGRKTWVKDKYAYMQQHPETQAPTFGAAKWLSEQRKVFETYHEKKDEYRQAKKEREDQAMKEGKTFGGTHGCVGGKIMKDCDECRSSFAVPGGERLPYVPCEKCRGSKLVWETCEECARMAENA